MPNTITKGYTFSATELVTYTKLHALVDNAVLTISGVSAFLDDIEDVSLSSPLASQALLYNGSAWVNASISQVTDHGALTGLTDDDHSIYSLVDGTRAFTGDITTASDKAFYFGASNVDGSWRIVRSGDNLNFERRESGEWEPKANILP